MKINKQKVEKFLAFTLAEVLITMIIITLMTLASIPVIKKSKEYREAAKDKNTWIAMYVPQADGSEKLTVWVDGEPDTTGQYTGKDGDQEYAKFIPPQGVTRFNVTVVGGGGGGAAGEAGIGTTKQFNPTDTIAQKFIPESDGLYNIVAIGGGGGGGGGASLCEGYGGWSGGKVIQRANLKKGQTYDISVGVGAGGGARKKIGEVLGDIFMPIGIVAFAALSILSGGVGLAIASGWIIGSWATAAVGSVMVGTLTSYDREQGGANGTPSTFQGEGVYIVAGGGGGGEHRRKQGFWPRCRSIGGCGGENSNGRCTNIKIPDPPITKPYTGPFLEAYKECKKRGACTLGGQPEDRNEYGKDKYETQANGDALYGSGIIASSSRPDGRTGGAICKGSDCENLKQNAGGMDVSFFGKAGDGGGRSHSGKTGSSGVVIVQELPVFGGGAGSPGAISFYSYTKSPLVNNEEFVKVFPGKGGKGGTENGAPGKDGMFSRFGNRIIADGGKGGEPRATNPAGNSTSSLSDMQAPGKDGIPGPVNKNLLDKIVYPSGLGLTKIDKISGGLNHSDNCRFEGNYSGKGNGTCQLKDILAPGSSGAGGGAQGSKSFNKSEIKWGYGGNGASGLVIVTW